MPTKQKLNKTLHGYFELANKPSQQELDHYYRNKYYQDSRGSYEHSYSDDEIRYYQNKLEQKWLILQDLLHNDSSQTRRLLDIGCGEGWTLDFFYKKGWQVHGIDFSQHGLHTHNKNLAPFIEIGDLYEKLQDMVDSSTRFDVVVLDNVLEHVLDPGRLLSMITRAINPDGLLIVEVPNDFSRVQLYLEEHQYIDRPFWIAVPDHISYFGKKSLQSLSEANGWKMARCLADHPIDMNLFNPDSNYITDKSKGKNCHLSRIAIENLLHDIDPEKTNRLYEAMADLGIGRQIIMFLQVAGS